MRTFSVASPRKRWLRDRVLPTLTAIPTVERRYTARLAQLSHNYRGGPLAVQAPRAGRRALAPGDRLPSVSGLELDGRPVSTLDVIGAPAHTLIVLTGRRGRAGLAREATSRLARLDRVARPIVISGPAGARDRQVVSDPDLRAHRRYGALDGRLLLVRPDGYLACLAPLDRADIPERYLRRLTSTSPQGGCSG